MYYTAFNPLNSFYKSKPGAVAAGTSLRLRVVLPRNFGVTRCELLIDEDNTAQRRIPMEWEYTDGVTEHWGVDFTPDSPSLLFYCFEYTAAWGKSLIRHNKNDFNGLIGGGDPWQLTVYSPDFKTPEWIKGGIIYQIFPDRFFFSGEEKENIPDGRILRSDRENLPHWKPDSDGIIRNNDYFCGDFKGIEMKLDYIASLGVNCIYLNPVALAHSNHRYDTADYMKPDPLLGTEEDFKSLCAACKKRKIRIILDGVYSHTGADSVYFNKYGRYKSTGAYQSEASPYYPWYSFGKTKDDYACWWNILILPEVNEEEPFFLRYITGENGVITHWLRLGAAGFRLDVADELPDGFLDEVRHAVKRGDAENLLLGEVWEDASNKISHGGRRRFLLGEQLDGVMNYPFRNAIVDFLLNANAEGFMYKILSVCENYPPQALNACMNHLGTHDTARIITLLAGFDCDAMSRDEQAEIRLSPEQYSRAVRLLKMAFSINYALPGAPSIYYGDEAGLSGGKDPFNRRFFPWGHEDKDLLEFTRSLGAFRRNQPVLKSGGFYPVSASLGCAAFLRYSEGMPRVMVIANKNPDEISYWLNDDLKNLQLFTGGKKIDGGVQIPGESCVILFDRF